MPITDKAQPDNREQPKKVGKNRFAHTAATKYGMGDNYGSGVKQKLGRMRDDSMGMVHLTPKRLKKPPKNLA